MFRRLAMVAALGAAGAAVATPARAALTFVDSQGNFGNERCLVGSAAGQCSGGAYDGAISIIQAMEMDLGLAVGSIVRVDDAFDQLWTATISNGGQVLARARYADHTLDFGFDTTAGAGGYLKLFGNIGDGKVRVSVPGEFAGTPHADDFMGLSPTWTNIPVSAGVPFAFVLRDLTAGNDWTSNNSGAGPGAAGYSNSASGSDHMVTFRVSSSAYPDHYFLAFEDLKLNSDFDFNDMVVEVRFVQPVPLPAALPLMLSGLVGLGILRRTASRTRSRR